MRRLLLRAGPVSATKRPKEAAPDLQNMVEVSAAGLYRPRDRRRRGVVSEPGNQLIDVGLLAEMHTNTTDVLV